MSNIFASNSEREITKFNGNSKEFTLGWDVKDNQSFGGYRKKEEFKETGPATRTDRFLDKKQPDMAVKIGAKGTEPPVTTAQTPKITRNDREKTNWFFGDKAPEPKKVEKVERTDKELDKLGKEFDELKVSEAKKKKEEISRLNNEKVEKLAKKAKEREPFRL